jgi:alpha-glucosidase
MSRRLLVFFSLLALAAATWVDPTILDACPGYNATNINVQGSTLTADLVLAGKPCNVFGSDITHLTLQVVYETGKFFLSACVASNPFLPLVEESRIHLKITDPSVPRYEVPTLVLPRPSALPSVSSSSALIGFEYKSAPFSFSIYRSKTKEVLFSTASHPIIFEPQYIRVKTDLPANPNLYGLGEHTDSFHLPTNNYTRTMWSRDAFGVPPGTNLYGNHPIYFEHRKSGTHGVFLLNSNGMDIKINQDPSASFATLEYNVIGGIIDLYFLAGSETDPTEAARQYSQVVGTSAEVPYWSFGLHQCRFGYHSQFSITSVTRLNDLK